MVRRNESTGILGYGTYLPWYRLKAEELTDAWGVKAAGIEELAVPAYDEDVITMAIEASRNAIKHGGVDPKEIGAVILGAESKPYSVKPSSIVIAEALGVTPKIASFDVEFSCKSDVSALNLGISLIDSESTNLCLVVGCGMPQGEPSDVLEASTSAGATAWIVGNGSDSVACFEDFFSFAKETPDLWRREADLYIRHGWRYESIIGYSNHIISAVKGLLEKMALKPEDFKYVVLYQPDGVLPLRVARKLGFSENQITPGLITCRIGNSRSASSLLGVSTVLDKAEPGERILVASYGTGGGSDAFSLKVQDKIMENRGRVPTFENYVNRKTYISYSTFLKINKRLKRGR